MFEYAPMALLALLALGVITTLLALMFRRVVATNEVHIVQAAKSTKSYGKDTTNGNTYYAWPTWVPVFGIQVTKFNVSIFDVDLEDFETFDSGRLQFLVDVKGFFRIADFEMAAKRVSSMEELINQLTALVKGAVRSVLANSDIDDILKGRSTFGDQFSAEVMTQLKEWGVESVKNLELMDIRDAKGSDAIHNITAKKQSMIAMQSRTEVAKNNREAEIQEIAATREIELQRQAAAEITGLRKVEAERKVQLSQQEATQALKEKEKLTKEREMEVIQVGHVRSAEITQKVAVVKAEQDKQTQIITAQATLAAQKLQAEGTLELVKRDAEGIALTGKAKADAEKAMQMAPVEAQVALADKIGANKDYQQYMVTIEQVKANRDVGVAQAETLKTANIKIIANGGTASAGLNSALDLFSTNGGTQVGAMLEGLAQTDAGKQLIEKFAGKLQ